jgi:hypothetical protein
MRTKMKRVKMKYLIREEGEGRGDGGGEGGGERVEEGGERVERRWWRRAEERRGGVELW